MLLSPRPFGSRLVVHLGVLYPELRPPLVAILSVRDTAHTFDLTRLLSTRAFVIGTPLWTITRLRGLAYVLLSWTMRPAFDTR